MYKDYLAFISNSLAILQYGVNIPSLARNLKMAAMLSLTILLFCNSLPFLWCKHTKPGEEPEDGGNDVLGVQRLSCFYF